MKFLLFQTLGVIFATFIGDLPQDTQIEYAKQVRGRSGIKLTDCNKYIRTEITNKSGRVLILKPDTKLTDGVTNWDSNTLPKYQNLLVTSIRAAYATDASETNSGKLKYGNLVSAIPAELLNAVLIISQENKVVFEVPFLRLFTEAKTQKAVGADDAFELINPILIKEGVSVKMEIQFPDVMGTTLASNKHHLELVLMGAQSEQRA